jgi:Holliday junction resolvasome RuvABC endonuclease subunit
MLSPFRIVGVDPSLASSGWWAGQVDPESGGDDYCPSWLDRKDYRPGRSNHSAFKRLASGTIKTSPGIPLAVRILQTSWEISGIISEFEPLIVAIESPIWAGRDRNTSGTALAVALAVAMPFRPDGKSFLVTIAPRAMLSMFHGAAAVKPAVAIHRHRICRNLESILSEHEADAYAHAYLGCRRILCTGIVPSAWGKDWFSKKEGEYLTNRDGGREGRRAGSDFVGSESCPIPGAWPIDIKDALAMTVSLSGIPRTGLRSRRVH